jgi:hypothetical protein
MSFAARLIHDLSLVKVTYSGTDDTYGQPPASESSSLIKGLVQDKTGDEAPDTRSAGVLVADHVVFLALSTDIKGADHLIWHRPDRENLRLQVVNVRAFEFGTSPHLEVDCRALAGALVGAGS